MVSVNKHRIAPLDPPKLKTAHQDVGVLAHGAIAVGFDYALHRGSWI